LQIADNKVDFTAIFMILGFIFIFFIMFNPLQINIDSFIFWITHINFYTFTTPEAMAGIFVVLGLLFLVIIGTNVKSRKYFSIFLLPVVSSKKLIIQQSTQTIDQADNYNPFAWFGRSGSELYTIALIIIFMLIIIVLLSPSSKSRFRR